MKRIKSRLWVEALLRRCQGEGKFGAIIKSGADEAGAIYVVINHLNGTHDLLAPPPGSATNSAGDRWFQKPLAAPQAWTEIQAYLERQKRFDADFWVVEIEDREALAGLLVAPT
jgi:hypothetical protein